MFLTMAGLQNSFLEGLQLADLSYSIRSSIVLIWPDPILPEMHLLEEPPVPMKVEPEA